MLKDIRLNKGLTRRDLSRMTGISYGLIRDFEYGTTKLRNTKLITVLKLCKALKCSVADLDDEDAILRIFLKNDYLKKLVFGEKILKDIRLNKGLTRRDLSRMTGISYGSIRDFEYGITKIRNTKLITVLKLCKALKCSVADLDGEDAILRIFLKNDYLEEWIFHEY